MHIGICEDNAHDLKLLVDCIKEDSSFSQQISFQIFYNADDLLQYLSNPSSQALTCLLLDIHLPSITGMEAAYRIREYNEVLPIIFISSSPDFAVESYRIRAFDYLLKPFTSKAIKDLF